MVPNLITINDAYWAILPPGVHTADMTAIKKHFAYNEWRRQLYGGLLKACVNLAAAGCRSLYLDGSFVTEKPRPGDFDACWEPDGVDLRLLDPVFLDFTKSRANQKLKFGGEFFPATTKADAKGRTYLEFFQIEKFTNQSKGIVQIDLSNDPMLNPQVTT